LANPAAAGQVTVWAAGQARPGAISRTGFLSLSFWRKRPISTLQILIREGR